MSIYAEAIKKFGVEAQKKKIVEELVELANAILHDDVENIEEECADWIIVSNYLELIYKTFSHERISKIKREKLRELEKLVSEDNR